MASSAFVNALKGQKAAIKKMRDAQPKEGYVRPKIDKGTYILAVTAEAGITPNKEVPYVKFNWEVQDEGEFQGKGANHAIFLDGDDQDKVDKNFESLSLAFRALLDLEEVDINDAADIEAYVDAVNKQKVYCRSKVYPWGNDEKGGFNVYFLERLEAE